MWYDKQMEISGIGPLFEEGGQNVTKETIRRRGHWAVFFLLTGVFLAIQVGRLTVPPWDIYESWRQSDTYSIARNFVQFGMDPLRPQLNYDGVAGNYAQLELQIVPYLSAVIYQLTGSMDPMVCRVLSLGFFLGSGVFVYLLLRTFVKAPAALAGYGMYLFLPLSLLMAAAIQPEACLLFFYCGGVEFLRRYQLTGKIPFLAAASVMTAVAIMEKTPAAFVGLVFLYVLWDKMGKRFYKNPWFYGCGLITLAPPVALLVYSSCRSTFRFVDGIAAKHILTDEFFAIFTPESQEFFAYALPTYLGWGAIVLSLLGMTLLHRKEYRFSLWWTVAFVLETVTIIAIIRFTYYLVFLLPVCAMLAALLIEDLARHRKVLAGAVCVLAACFIAAQGSAVWEWTEKVEKTEQIGQFIAENTGFDDGVAVGAGTPVYLNAANRRGYRANLRYYDYIPQEPDEEIAYFIDHGVRWMVVREGYIDGDDDGSYLAYVQANYPVHAANELCVIYDLTPEGDEGG